MILPLLIVYVNVELRSTHTIRRHAAGGFLSREKGTRFLFSKIKSNRNQYSYAADTKKPDISAGHLQGDIALAHAFSSDDSPRSFSVSRSG
ncbi:MAG: hypothetical protein HY961_05935 [Ignavibacteriae bacterium]|nr:hypothetical protein [Ignavibacteriota bacterium]